MSEWIDVSDITPRIAYTATASQTAFVVPFVFFENSNLNVYQNSTLLTLDTSYTVTGAEDEDGGTVTLLTGAALGDEILITRHVPVEQTTHIPPSGPLDVPAINVQISKLVAMIQQQADQTERAVHLPDNDSTVSAELASAATRANRLFGFDTNGDLIYPLGPTFVGETSTGVANVDSVATAQVTSFDLSVNIIQTGGYAAPGDGGGAQFEKVVSLATDAFGFQSADGAWWQLSEERISVLMTGAQRGGSDSTDAINAAIRAARVPSPGFGFAYTGSEVFFPPGIYCVSSIDATQTACLTLRASAMSVIIYGNKQVGVNRPVIDLTGSSACIIDSITVSGQNPDGTAPTALPSCGFLLAEKANGSSNKNRLTNCGSLGQFVHAALFLYGATDCIFDGCGFQQDKIDAPCLFASTSNDYGTESSYTTVNTALTTSTGENTFYSCEFHGNRTAGGLASTVVLHGVYATRFYGGNNDANGSTVAHYQFQGTSNAITINGVQIYSETGNVPAYIFQALGLANVNGLIVMGVHALFNAGSTQFAGAGFNSPIVMASPGLTSLP